MNSKKKGDIGLGAAIAYFTENGYTVCIPLTDSQDYDLVVDIDGLKKIQIKTTYYKRKDRYEVSLSVKGGNKSSNTIKKFDWTLVDFIFILTSDGTKYLIPSDNTIPKHSFSLGKDKEKFKI
jgi:hypothetical protein